mmetsp:Transcript_48532/g.97641  ORF Transcript_48532/g.97641 Transcript_48532/m.97641 type:complete len:93 (-) Transcript_48532:189-467(-)
MAGAAGTTGRRGETPISSNLEKRTLGTRHNHLHRSLLMVGHGMTSPRLASFSSLVLTARSLLAAAAQSALSVRPRHLGSHEKGTLSGPKMKK